MAKRTSNSSVNSSIRQQTRANDEGLGKLLEVQQQSLGELTSIKELIVLSKEKEQEKSGGTSISLAKQLIETQRKLMESNKKLADEQKATRVKISEEAEIIAKMALAFKTFKTPLEKLKDSFSQMGNAFKNPGRTLMKSLNIGGIFNKQIAKSEFIDKQKALGSTKSNKELNADFEAANKVAKEIAANEKKLADLKKKTGISSEAKLAQTPEGKLIMERREATAAQYKKYDMAAQLNEDGRDHSKAPLASLKPATPTAAAAASLKDEEAQEEQSRIIGEQTELLKLIEEHTRPAGAGGKNTSSTGGEEGGGILGGIGAGLGKLGKGLGSLLRSVGGGAGKGIQLFLRGLASGVAALANPASLVGLGAFTLAMMGLGKALELAAPAIEAFAPVLMKVAEVIGDVFMKAIEKLPEIIKTAGDVIMGIISTISDSITGLIDEVITSIERLSKLDGGSLLSVAGGLLAISGAMAAFGAGQAVAGLGNLVGKLLSFGGDSPVEQLIKIGEQGENLNKAADGMGKIGDAMGKFSKIDKKTMEAINDFPWVRATAFVAAGGSMQVNGASVTNASKNNADMAAANQGSGGGNTNVVNAPVTNTSKTTNVVRPKIRNNESSHSRWQSSRYAT